LGRKTLEGEKEGDAYGERISARFGQRKILKEAGGTQKEKKTALRTERHREENGKNLREDGSQKEEQQHIYINSPEGLKKE